VAAREDGGGDAVGDEASKVEMKLKRRAVRFLVHIIATTYTIKMAQPVTCIRMIRPEPCSKTLKLSRAPGGLPYAFACTVSLLVTKILPIAHVIVHVDLSSIR